jgi:hypothetical protein
MFAGSGLAELVSFHPLFAPAAVALGVFLIVVKAKFELVDPNLGEPVVGSLESWVVPRNYTNPFIVY